MNQITIEQIKSSLRRPKKQKLILIGLKLNKLHRRSTLKNTPQVQGMINKIKHLIKIV